MSGHAPERPRVILKPDPPLFRRDTTDGDTLWARPGLRMLLWAFLSAILLVALRIMRMTDFAPGPLLFGAAVLLPPLFFASIVPPRGFSWGRGYLYGLFATGALMPLLALLGWLVRARFQRYYEAALSWG